MNPKNFIRFLSSNIYEPTKLSNTYEKKSYPETTEIKNSRIFAGALLIGMTILSIFLLNIKEDKGSKVISIIFCSIIIIVPLFAFLDKRPLLILSNKGIKFKNGDFKEWSEINETLIETTESSILLIRFKNSKKKRLGLEDLNYSQDEISHMIEYYKSQKNCR